MFNTAQQEMDRKHDEHMRKRKQQRWLEELFARANLVTAENPTGKIKKGKSR